MLVDRVRSFYRSPLEDGLDWIQRRSVFARSVDWGPLREEARRVARAEPNPDGRYRALRLVLDAIGDVHGAVLDPDRVAGFRRGPAIGAEIGFGLLATFPDRSVAHVYPGGAAERAGIVAGEVIESINGEVPRQLGRKPLLDLQQSSPAVLAVRRNASIEPVVLDPSPYTWIGIPTGRLVSHDVGYMHVPPASMHAAAQYLSAARSLIVDFDRAGIHRWVLDLRLNVGGDLYVMFAALAPLLGERDIGGLVDARDAFVPWSCRSGAVFLGSRPPMRSGNDYRLRSGEPHVALLSSRLTASAGEAVVVAFTGGPRTRSFGEATAGLATGLEDRRLRDGGLVRCSTTLFADRARRTFRGPIGPDHLVACDWREVGTPGDTVLRAAVDWLRQR
jgi:C-terminal processing protease CtpA/Prc